MEKISGVYLVTCLANGRMYVGSSKDIQTRWREHRADLDRNKHCNDHWQKAWNKYGANQFEWAILETTPLEDAALREREQHWIDVLHPDFNVSDFAFPTRLGAKNDKAHRRSISIGQARKWASLSEDERKERCQIAREAWEKQDAAKKEAIREKLRKQSEEQARRKLEKNAAKRAQKELEKQQRREARAQAKAERERKKAEWTADAARRKQVHIEKLRAAAIANWQDPAYRTKHRKATRKAMQDPAVLERLSESHKGKPLTEEQKRKIGEAHRGMKRPPETGKRISKAKMGHPVSEETRRKISETKRRKREEGQ